jgi:UDP-N-acetylmuramate dehydrogenase
VSLTVPKGVKTNVRLAPFTTWQIGGEARYFFEPDSCDALQSVLDWARQAAVKWAILGRGSNVLIGDDGFDGLVVRTGAAMTRVSFERDTDGVGWMRAQAGVPLAAMVMAGLQEGLGGLEPMVGVPGTVGGAVVMHAGAHGVTIAEGFESGRVLLAGGDVVTWTRDEFRFGYRHSRLLDEPGVFLEGVWKMRDVDRTEARRRVVELQQWRHQRQPTNFPSGGSTFRNPGEGLPSAGAMIEQVGGKGLRFGGAEVSQKHANFIVNRDRARAEDINALIIELQQRVLQCFGVWLVPEVVGLGMAVGDIR